MGIISLAICTALGGGGGWWLEQRYKRILQQEEEYLDFLRATKRNVELFKMPMAQQIESCKFKTQMGIVIAGGKAKSISEKRESEIADFLESISQKEQASAILEIEKQQEISLEHHKKAKADFEKNGVLAGKLGLLLGLLIGVVTI